MGSAGGSGRLITSIQNERIKHVRSLARRRVRHREGLFVVEGTRLVDEMIRAGIRPALVLYTAAWSQDKAAQPLLPALAVATEGSWLVTETVLEACADTETPQGVLAVVPHVTLPPRPGLLLLLDGLRDPGNLGTILRSAEAAGVGQVLLLPGTVDLYNPKVVRAGMGAHFRLPAQTADWQSAAVTVADRAVWLADAGAELTYDGVDWTQPSALIIGGEAVGAGSSAAALATGRIRIPMMGSTESLNAAMAATVILFEAAKQWRSVP